MTSSTLTIQDPERPGQTLQDTIIAAAEGADRGGGIFAFASSAGIELLLSDSVFDRLCDEHSFRLVVGVDSITDARALETLERWTERLEGLTTSVLVHKNPWMFHPKVSWFGADDKVTLITGSGNLTKMGLTTNYEAFSVMTMEGQTANSIETEIRDWLDSKSDLLYPPSATEAKERALQNSGSERSFRRPMPPDEEPGDDSPLPDASAEILIAQIPKNAPGRMQLDVGFDQYRDFFGGVPDKPKRIQIHHVESTGDLGEPEPARALFKTKSTNFRFEARPTGVNLDYPSEGRPIGVFVRMPNGVFRYVLLRPGEAGHSELNEYLDRNVDLPANRMKRLTTTLAEFEKVWPKSPLQRMSDTEA